MLPLPVIVPPVADHVGSKPVSLFELSRTIALNDCAETGAVKFKLPAGVVINTLLAAPALTITRRVASPAPV